MSRAQFATLTELPLREAWKHEALDFTPWLSKNIEFLAEAIGIPLELTGTEVAVDNFSADVLARNPMDDTVVLIENQLEVADHNHLGQIMTYLAGLDAHTVVWIAPTFRDAHLSAISWLNQNTADGFSFIAVKAKVVRIGDSPFAPIFEVVAKPDNWSRRLSKKRDEASGSRAPHSDTRLAFWTHYGQRHPKAAAEGVKPIRGWNSYFVLSEGDVRVSVWIGQENAGIYIGGGHADGKLAAQEKLADHVSALGDSLGADWFGENPSGHVLGERLAKSYLDPGNWDEICDWMEERRNAYIDALTPIVGGLQ